MASRLDYRKDLDGLRAVAVMPVILYHLGVPWISGGFVGVDVFFVLSGYFITRQIANDLDAGRFTLLGFYDRRIRRLFPALMAMLLASTALAFVLLLPHDLQRYGSTLAAAALSVSNFAFWRMADYFAPAAESLPLLHTWSLAVEEQFYIGFPLLMMLIWPQGHKRRSAIIVAIAALSLAASIWGVWSRPAASFYLLPTRAWELALGSILALAITPLPANETSRGLAASAGLAAIVAAMLLYSPRTPTPGLAALLPCLGCALVIWSGEGRENTSTIRQPIVTTLLCARPVVFTGLISYSLYLWHWPIIVFARQASIGPLSGWTNAGLLILTFAAASASWRFIEQPLRHGTILWTSRRRRFVSAAAAISGAVAVGLAADVTGGLPGRLPPEALSLSRQVQDFSPLRKRCHADGQGTRAFEDTCVTGSASDRRIVVLADSHGAELGYALWEQAAASRLNVRVITASGCPPSTGFQPPANVRCRLHVERMLAGLEAHPASTVIMTAYYARWSEPELRQSFWDGYARTVATLRRAGHDVILLGGVPPHLTSPVPDALTKWVLLRRDPDQYTFPVDEPLMQDIDGRLDRLARETGARYAPLQAVVCGRLHACPAHRDGHAIYFDTDHITVSTARHVLRSVVMPLISGDSGASR